MGDEGKLLGKEEIYRLIDQTKCGDGLARERLIQGNVGLVKSLALKFVIHGYELDDLMQVGFIGLIKAIDGFDTKYDVMFSTYAVPMILGELKRFIRDDGRIKVNRQTKQDVKRMRLATEEFLQREGKSPRLSQIAQMMGETVERIAYLMEAQEAMYGMESLDDPESGAKLISGGHPEEKIVEQLNLKSAISTLSDREQKVLLLRYYRDMTQQQIADRMGMSQVQISRMEKRIMGQLRSKMIENV